MKYLLIFVVVAAAFSLGECRFFKTEENVKEKDKVTSNCGDIDVDAYLDKVIARARKELPDPMRLPPKSTFSSIDLVDGVLWGMSTLERFGKADVHCANNITTITAKLTVEQLKGRYTWRKERKNKSDWEGYVVFISDDFEADTVLVIERHEGEETHPRLEKFQIQKFKDARIEMTGMGFLTWAVGEMTTLMSGIFQRSIAGSIQDPLKESLERYMREITLE